MAGLVHRDLALGLPEDAGRDLHREGAGLDDAALELARVAVEVEVAGEADEGTQDGSVDLEVLLAADAPLEDLLPEVLVGGGLRPGVAAAAAM